MNRILRIILFLLIILVGATILKFSSQKASQSDNTSKNIVRKLVDIIHSNYTEEEKVLAVEKYNGITRKLAHFSLYYLLGTFVISYLLCFNNPNLKTKIIIALSLSLLYAISDEIHQNFVAGRSCELGDVFIDFTGICLGTFVIVTAYLKFKKGLKSKRGF